MNEGRRPLQRCPASKLTTEKGSQNQRNRREQDKRPHDLGNERMRQMRLDKVPANQPAFDPDDGGDQQRLPADAAKPLPHAEAKQGQEDEAEPGIGQRGQGAGLGGVGGIDHDSGQYVKE